MDARISLKQTDMAILRERSFGAEHFPLAKSAIDVQNRRDTKKTRRGAWFGVVGMTRLERATPTSRT